MEGSDEASELASLAGSVDTEAARPSSFLEEGTHEPVSPPSTGSAAPSGSPAPPHDSSSNNACKKC